MTIFEHMSKIDELMDKRIEAEAAVLLQATGGGSGIGLGFASGDLQADVFGNVRVQDSPFIIGKIDSHGYSGDLHSDVFGNVKVGDSPFNSGTINNYGQQGDLHTDVFGDVRVGDSPFISGDLD